MKNTKADYTTVEYHISSLQKYIDRHILCDAVGIYSKQCDELLNLKATALNLIEEAGAYCNKAIRIANKEIDG